MKPTPSDFKPKWAIAGKNAPCDCKLMGVGDCDCDTVENEITRLRNLMLEMWDTEHDHEWQYMLKPESYEAIKAMFGRARQPRD